MALHHTHYSGHDGVAEESFEAAKGLRNSSDSDEDMWAA